LRRAKVNAVGDVSFGTRLRGWLAAAWRFVRTAPLTYLWLAVLLGTTIRQLQAGRHLHRLLVHASTNIHDLATDPLHVLFESLLWIDGRSWTPYLVLFTLFLAPAEHWLGQMRWLTVGLTAHVGATYTSARVGCTWRFSLTTRRSDWSTPPISGSATFWSAW
jgi:hypothetical protein